MIYKVKIIKCSLPFMWYNAEIGKEYKCKLENSEKTHFNAYTDNKMAYKTIDKIQKTISKKHTIIENSIGYKILLNESEVKENIKVNGWILIEDVEITEQSKEIKKEDIYIEYSTM